jgi:predicted TPR repeat methyltransferase
MANPVINPAILISPVETGYVAYDPGSDKLHHLNPMAALLAELCDGTRSVDDLRRLVGPIVPEGKVNEIDHWVDEGLKAGLLVSRNGNNESYHEFSPDQLYEFASRLKSLGKMQTAFLCLQKTVELKPDHSDAWYKLGDVAQSVGRRAEARVAYEKYLELEPGDAELEQILVALRDEAPPERAPDRCIQQIYADFAWHYESQMREDLKYQGPERIVEVLKSMIGGRQNLSILDIGCGSGLAGVALKPLAARMIGVDLSPEMLELARKRNIYDKLEVAEITEWMENSKDQFDVVTCCDCLIYFGDLRRVVSAAGKRLKEGGVFVFSTERGDVNPFKLTDTGRYAHHPQHVRDAAAEAGLSVGYLDEAFLRMEYGSEVIGLFAAVKK